MIPSTKKKRLRKNQILRMSKEYYKPEHYWMGDVAVERLSEAANVSTDVAKDWLLRQAIYQIYQPAPKHIPRPTSNIGGVSKLNYTHQADLLYLSHDKVDKKIYRYALVVIDEATRYKDAEPITSKTASETAKAFETIYSRGKLKWPKILKVDSGKEFMKETSALLKEKNVQIQVGIIGNHRSQGLVERANRAIAEQLYKYQ